MRLVRRTLLLVVMAAVLVGCKPDTDLQAMGAADRPASDVLGRFEQRGHPCEVDPDVRVVGDGVLCDMAGIEGHVSLFHDTPAEQRRRLTGCQGVGAIAGEGWTLLLPDQPGLDTLAGDLGGRSVCG